MSTIDEALPPGAHVSGYVIERVLGQGGFAFTYLAHDERLTDSKFALKEFFPQDLARRTQRVQVQPTVTREQVFREGLLHFIEEGKALLQFKGYAGIVQAQRYVEAHGTAYLVMDYVAGESLQQALATSPRSRWTEPRVRQLASQLLEALGVVHQAGLLHRDINPSNILLTSAGRPVLIDFGAARQQLAERTRTGDRVATAGYSPPEQYSHELGAQAPSSDLYALGATLYEVVTGSAPPLALSRIAGQFKGRDPLVPAAESVAGNYSPELLAWIDWHLTLNQDHRPASVMQSLARLAQTAAPALPPTEVAEIVPVRTTPVDPKLRFPVAGSAAAATVQPEPSKPRTTPVDPAQRFAGHVPPPTATVLPASRTRTALVIVALLAAAGAVALYAFERAGTRSEDTALSPAPVQRPDPAPPASEPAAILPQMVTIPAGSFVMGSPESEEGRFSDEGPLTTISVKSFKLGKHEVTVGEFRRFAESSPYQTNAEKDAGGNDGCLSYQGGTDFDWKTPGFELGEDHPVVCVSWNDAQAYIQWLNTETGGRFRLPSEAEQEYSIRAGSKSAYAWGGDVNQVCTHGNVLDRSTTDFDAVSCDDGAVFPSKAGAYEENTYGLHDTIGNVREWGQDCAQAYPGGSRSSTAIEVTNCENRVLRGAAWNDGPVRLRSAIRGWNDPVSRDASTGFRLAEDL